MRLRSGRPALLAAAAAAALALGGCSSNGSQEPSASHSSAHHRRTSVPSDTAGTSSSPAATGGPSTASSSPASAAALAFDPASAGRHSHVCIQVTGTDPVDYIYYPVVVTPSAAVTLDDLTITYADGVQMAGSWVAPAPANAGTGFIEGWPAPPILTQSSSVQWSKRVDATGAALAAGTPYNVFLHLRVYPDALPYRTSGIVLSYHDDSGSRTDRWVDQVTYRSAC